MSKDWKLFGADCPEKYQAYLCSREWNERVRAVRRRCRNVCERCGKNRVDHVHHLTYAHKYDEPLEDLQGICRPCHNFIHGRSDYDPAKPPCSAENLGPQLFGELEQIRGMDAGLAKLRAATDFHRKRLGIS